MSELVFLNHPRGEGQFSALGKPVEIDLDKIQSVSLPKAKIHNGLFEVPYRDVMGVLPASLHPATPAYGSLMFVHAPESPIGAFDFVLFGVACRSGIRPRLLTLSAFASSGAAVDLLATFGISASQADIDTRFGYDAAIGVLRDTDGKTIAEMSTSMADVLLGSTRAIRYPQPLSPVKLDDKTGLIQFDMAFEYGDGWRGPVQVRSFDDAAISAGGVGPTDLIGGTVVTADITLLPPRLLLDPTEVGLVTKLETRAKTVA